MKLNIKKYPLLISAIVSCAIVVASLFILGFFGMNLGTSIGGGSQFEVTIKNDANVKDYISVVKDVVSDNGLTVDNVIVEDNFKAADTTLDYTTRCLVVKIAKKDISDAKETAIKTALAEKLEISENGISNIDNITSVVKTKNVLFLGLALGIIMVCLFVAAWLRYDIFAGISFILANLHNMILFLSLIILTRVQLNMISLASIIILSLIMSSVMVVIYEKYREQSRLQTAEKMTVSERLISSEFSTIKPFAIIAGAAFVVALMLLFVPVVAVKLAAIGVILALLVTAYSTLIIGPASYAALLELRSDFLAAKLSRNDTVNKQIKKKVQAAKKEENKKSSKKADNKKA